MKIFYKFGIVVLVNLFYFLSVKASDFEVDGIAYNIISDNQVEVTGKSGFNFYAGSIVIPEKVNYQNSEYTVTKIGDNAFFMCKELTGVTLSNSLTSIGEQSFVDCESLLKIDLPNSLTSIGAAAFSNSGLIYIKIPENVSFLGDMTFEACLDLESIEVDSNNLWYTSTDGILYNKEVSLLIWCPSALSQKYLTLPESLIKIGNSAFSFTTVKNINIPNSVKEIGDLAFFNSYIETIDIPASVMEIGYGTFAACYYLNSINVDSQNPNFSSLDDILYNNDSTQLISCPATKREVTIPETVKEIGNYAFYGCQFTEIVLPASVAKIGDNAFNECKLLSNVTLSDSLQTIGEGAFEGCAFSGIKIPESVTEIGENAFAFCLYLESIVIPDGVKTIKTLTFVSCDSLKKIVFGKSVNLIEPGCFYFTNLINEITCKSVVPPVWDEMIFDFDIANCNLYVPAESIGIYRTTNPWSRFGIITEINEAGIESILNNKTSGLSLYELNGRKILETNNKSEITNLPKGIYIIVSGKERYKISI